MNRAEKMYAFIVEALDSGRTVYLHTATRITKIQKKHLPQVRVHGEKLQVQHGNRWLDHTRSGLTAE